MDPPVDHKPSVLIIGGLGFIGRYVAKYIHTNNLASTIRIVDKILPQLAHLAPEFKEACSPTNFLQADASRETSMARIFDNPSVPNGSWDYVFNVGGETAWGQSAEIYKLRATQLSVTLAKEAAKRNVKAYVEISTSLVYASNRTPRTEADKLKPSLKMAKAKLEAEQEMSRIPGLNLVILRPAHAYGPYDHGFIAKALCLARVYQEENKELKWLWTEDLRINTVHVEDLARACWTAAEWRASNTSIPPPTSPSSPPPSSRRATFSRSTSDLDSTSTSSLNDIPTFNIVDHGATTQGHLASLISRVFALKTGFHGTLISQFARLNLENVVDDLNEDLLQPWADMLERKQLGSSGPLSPFLEKELLRPEDLSLDGGLFERVTGFRYDVEGLSEEGVRGMLKSYERMGWWP